MPPRAQTPPAHSATQRNLDYYGELAPGRSDYWRFMAAPRFRAATIVTLVRDAAPGSVLDLGCGDGSLLFAIAREVPAATLCGIDLSPAQIAENRQRAPGVEWWAANLEDQGFSLERTCEALVSSEVIEHLGDPGGFLRSIRRFAAPGGLLVLSTQSGVVGQTERQVGHLRHFTAAEMAELLEAAGWREVRVWNAGFPFQDLSKRIANLAPRYAMTHFGERKYGLLERMASAALRGLFRLNSNRRGAQLFAVARNPQ